MNLCKFKNFYLLLSLSTLLFSCSKKGDFIDEGLLGSGIHYYPEIVEDAFVDTISGQALSSLKVKKGQQITFEFKFKSLDSIDRVELWAIAPDSARQKVFEQSYKSSFYSETQDCDTLFLSYSIPASKDSLQEFWELYPTVVTKKELSKSIKVRLAIDL